MNGASKSKDELYNTVMWILGLVLSVIITMVTWTMTTVVDVDGRVKVLEDTRFSKSDAYELENRITNQLNVSVDRIKECLNIIQRGRECE